MEATTVHDKDCLRSSRHKKIMPGYPFQCVLGALFRTVDLTTVQFASEGLQRSGRASDFKDASPYPGDDVMRDILMGKIRLSFGIAPMN
jgi:hypothetical protein